MILNYGDRVKAIAGMDVVSNSLRNIEKLLPYGRDLFIDFERAIDGGGRLDFEAAFRITEDEVEQFARQRGDDINLENNANNNNATKSFK